MGICKWSSAITWREQEIRNKMFLLLCIRYIQRGWFYSVISLKERSTCRHFTYFETNNYVILCQKQIKKDRGTKNERTSLFFSHYIYITYKCILPQVSWKWCIVTYSNKSIFKKKLSSNLNSNDHYLLKIAIFLTQWSLMSYNYRYIVLNIIRQH